MGNEKQKIATSERIAEQLKGNNPATVAGAANVARKRLALDELKMKEDIELVDKLTENEVYVTYQGDEAVIPGGKVLFNAVLLSADRKGNRPVDRGSKIKTVHASPIFDVQTVVKVGQHVTELVVGDKVLINVDQFLQRNVRPPTLILSAGEMNREYLTLSERDIKYIY